MKQIFYELKSQPLIATVTILGTALAVFLIMVVVMMQQVQVAPFAPESNRDRVLHGHYVHLVSLSDDGSESSMATSLSYLREIYSDMPGVERISYVYCMPLRSDLVVTGSRPYTADLRAVDNEFFNIFDFTFVAGQPFDAAESQSGVKTVVLSESMARNLFGSTDVVGREVLVKQIPFTVRGVVKDVSSLAKNAYGQAFIPFTSLNLQDQTFGKEVGGPFEAYLLKEKGASTEAIKVETERRVSIKSSAMKADNYKLVYHEQPYTEEEYIEPHGSNTTPDVDTARRQRYLIYAVLLIIPAINLSSMTQSRLRRRISEIGVRRAFGCTRSRVVIDILVENFAVTLIGGIIGLIFSVVFAWLLCAATTASYGGHTVVTASMLISWTTLIFALLFCFLLNLLSSGIPAWRASRVNPVEALAGLTK